MGRANELRKTQNQDADSLLIGGRQHGCFAINASEQSVLRSRRTRARFGGVGPRHTIDEPDEQRRAIFGGAWGEKGAGQGEHCSSQHQPDTVRGWSVPWIERCASSSTSRQSSKVGAVCGSAARTVLCGGRSVMIVPTATSAGINRYVAGNERVLQERSQRLHLGPQSCRRHREMTPEA